MADFNIQTEEATINELEEYGYTHLETIGVSPVIMYFNDALNSILKLSIDVVSEATVYGYYPDECHREQEEALSSTVVTDLISLDAVLIPVYTFIDPVLIKEEALTDIVNRTVLVPGGAPYFTTFIFTEPLTPFTMHNVGEDPSPYRERDLIWVPVTFLGPAWALVHNTSVIVNTVDVVTNALGDFVVCLPEE